MTTTQYLQRPDGRLAYAVRGDPAGPLVICSPGMGDLRSTFDALTEALVADGVRVATTDLRGHGESSLGWPDYSPAAVADDLLALIAALGGRAVLLGNSYSGSAAVLAAAREPAAVAGLVLAGAFVREHPASLPQRLLTRLFARTWPGRPLWTLAAWPSFFSASRPTSRRGGSSCGRRSPAPAATPRCAG